MKKIEQKKGEPKQPNALLTFAGEQDLCAFGVVCKAMDDEWREESGGSRGFRSAPWATVSSSATRKR